MAGNLENVLQSLIQLNGKLALELVFAEPGKDNGLLPLNCLLTEMEEISAPCPLPADIQQGLAKGRQWVDAIFNTTGLFSEDSLKQLGEWTHWYESALQMAAQGQPVPPMPEAWSVEPAPTVEQQSVTEDKTTPKKAEKNEESAINLDLASDVELLREFISESHEHLQNIELGVLVLEDKPGEKDTLNSIFRAFHTFKGGSGLLNLKPVNRLAHELESLLDLARQQKIAITSEVIDLILTGGDTLKHFTLEIEHQLNGEKPLSPIIIPTLHLIQRVKQIAQGTPSANLAVVGGEPATAADAARDEAASDRTGSAPVGEAQESATASETTHMALKEAGSGSIVKVATQKLDSLIDLVGEMVIAQSQVAQDPTLQSLAQGRLLRNLNQLTRITNELQKITMSLRMVPIRSTFQKMNRLVRDLAARQGKSVELKLHGEDTELDRTIVEQLNDPLVHMIRNSVDHGIEMPEKRTGNNKPAQGTIDLSAWHQGGNIVIQIKDDGGGLNRDKIFQKGVERGLIQPDENLTEQEVFHLIFEPGFSTADVITDVSGRGVGMDVVRRNIEKLRGKIEIQSKPGEGSSFTIFLPLTLAIIDGLLVSVGEQRYILPALLVRESFRPARDMITTVAQRGEVVNVRGHLSPLLRLHEYFGIKPESDDPTEGVVVVVGSEHQNRCLLVDHLLGKQEVVIKSLGETFKQNRALAGAAILGDGRVGLIVDIDYLVKLKGDSMKKAA